MGKKLELVLYPIEIEKYISELTNEDSEPAGSEEKRKARAALAHFVKMLKDNGRTWPEITDFEAFAANSKATANETTANDRRIRKFFAWFETERKNDTMTDNDVIDVEETAQPLVDGASSETTAPIEPEETEPEETKTTPAPVRKKLGRKNGEKRVQVSVYLNPETYEGIRLMSANMNQTISDILEVFARNFVDLNQEAIQRMRSAWSEVKVRFK